MRIRPPTLHQEGANHFERIKIAIAIWCPPTYPFTNKKAQNRFERIESGTAIAIRRATDYSTKKAQTALNALTPA